MIRRLVLENFMSHERTEFVFEPGLNVIAGANNVGKSAIAEALRCVATGGRATDYVLRHGARRASVTVETSEGDVVTWSRSAAGATRYELNGESFLKAAGTVPAPVAAALRLALVDVGSGDPVEVHLAAQKEPLFLLARTPGDVARFFSASSDAHLLLRMQALHQQRVADARQERRLEHDRVTRLDAALAGLASVEELAARQADLEAARADLGARFAAARRLADLRRHLAESMRRRAAHARRREAIASLVPPPDLRDSRPLRRIALALAGRRTSLASLRERRPVLARLAVPPSIAPTAPLRAARERLARDASRLAARHQARQAAAMLRPAPSLADPRDLRRVAASLATATEALERLRAARAEALLAAQAAGDALEAYRGQLGTCPLCGAALGSAGDGGEHRHHVAGREGRPSGGPAPSPAPPRAPAPPAAGEPSSP